MATASPTTVVVPDVYNYTNSSTAVSNPTASENNVDFLDPLTEHIVLTSLLIAMLIVMIVLGTFGNIMIIMAVCISKKLRTPSNLLIANLAIADIGVAALVNPFSLIGVIMGYKFFHRYHTLCDVVAVVCLVCCIASLLNIMTIAINRYIALCKHQLYPQIFTWRNTTLLCVAIWVASILIDIPTTLGWGSNGYDEKAMICLYDRTYEYSYTLFFAITSVFIPIGIVFICYLKIFLFVRAKKKELRLAENAGTTPTTARNSKAQRDEIRLARTLFIIFIAFFICWGSYAFLVVFDIYDKAPKIWHAISIELAHATSSGVNFILYGATNAQFRNAYKQILCPRRAQVAPSSMVTHTEGITMQKARFSNYRAATGETIKQVETIT